MRVRADLPPIEWHPRLPTTQDRLRERAAAGAEFGTAVAAGEQTRGRGRGGKGWISEDGEGLWMSVLLARSEGGDPGGFSLVAGLRVAVGLEGWIGRPVMVKWPNDLFVMAADGKDGEWRKVGGILCETARRPDRGSEGRVPAVAVGIGINVRGAPEGAASLARWAGTALEVPEVASRVLDAVVPRPAGTPLRMTEGDRRALERRDLLRGRRVRVEGGPEGVAVGIGADGALRVRDDEGREHRIWSGSIHPASGRYGIAEGAMEGVVP